MSGSDGRILLTCEINRDIWFLVYGEVMEGKMPRKSVRGMLKCVEGSVLRFGGV